MKKAAAIGILVCASVFFMGMGDLTGGDEAPKPAKFFAATITDKDLVTMQAEYIACEGGTTIKATLGKASITIPFEKISIVEFQDAGDGFQETTIKLFDGTEHKVKTRNLVKCTGHTKLGAIAIKTADLLKVEFQKDAKPPKPETETE